MKLFNWNPEKNRQLVNERGIAFEEIIFLIQNGYLLDEIEHPNSTDYPNQRIFIVEVDAYVYMVPFIENNDELFLKTIIPSRKLTRIYLGDNHEQN